MSGRAVVVVASTRAAAGDSEDKTGPIIVDWLAERGLEAQRRVVADGPGVAEAMREAVEAGVEVLVTTGGTGLTPDDTTPEATAALLDREIPGIAEELRRRGLAATPTSMLSRGLAGVAGSTFVVNLPGSRGGVRDGLAVLDEVLTHLLDQIAGRRTGHHA